MYDLQRIKTEFRAACAAAGISVTTEIKLNGRLKTTLGRVSYKIESDGLYHPVGVEFSKSFIETNDDEAIHQTILHEAAHYIVIKRTGEGHGHDAVFKAVCAEIGCYEDSTTSKISKVNYKYLIYCPHCGVVAGRHKKCRLTEKVYSYSCAKCGSKKLYVKEMF